MSAESVNLGPLEALFDDDSITEIMVNNYRRIFVEKGGQMLATNIKFNDEKTLVEMIQQIARACGRQITADRPFMDGYLDDGSRVNAVLAPMAPGGANITIRKFRKAAYTVQNMVQLGTLNEKCAFFLDAAIRSRLNIIVSGGTGTGKTTFLNMLSSLIPNEERVITIEDTAELQLQHPNWVRLESVHRPDQKGVTSKDCLVNALRMRPDRIIVGECRKEETFEMLQAMNTGHEGSMTTIHANSPRDCLTRIESLVASSGVDFPLVPLRKQIVSAIDLVIQLKRTKDGDRIVSEVLELTGMEQDTITSQPVFTRDKKQLAMKSAAAGEEDELLSTGLVPTCVEKMQAMGIQIPRNFFNTDTKVTFKA